MSYIQARATATRKVDAASGLVYQTSAKASSMPLIQTSAVFLAPFLCLAAFV